MLIHWVSFLTNWYGFENKWDHKMGEDARSNICRIHTVKTSMMAMHCQSWSSVWGKFYSWFDWYVHDGLVDGDLESFSFWFVHFSLDPSKRWHWICWVVTKKILKVVRMTWIHTLHGFLLIQLWSAKTVPRSKSLYRIQLLESKWSI